MEQNQPQPPVFNQPPVQEPVPEYQPRVTASPTLGPVEAVTTCFKKYFDFKGRARRSEFWWFIAFVVIVSIAITFLSGLVPALGYVGMLFFLATVIPEMAVLTRRLHDANHSGWWVVLLVLLLIGYYVSFGILMLPLGNDLMAITDPMEMATVLVDALQANPVAAGVMALCSMAMMLLSLILLIFTLQDSKWGANKWGPSPKYK